MCTGLHLRECRVTGCIGSGKPIIAARPLSGHLYLATPSGMPSASIVYTSPEFTCPQNSIKVTDIDLAPLLAEPQAKLGQQLAGLFARDRCTAKQIGIYQPQSTQIRTAQIGLVKPCTDQIGIAQ